MTNLGEKLTRADVDVFMYAVLCSLNYAYSKVSYRKPVPMYLKWENDDIYDIGMYHMPKREKKKSDYSHTIYSNTRSRTKTKNLERHKELMLCPE